MYTHSERERPLRWDREGRFGATRGSLLAARARDTPCRPLARGLTGLPFAPATEADRTLCLILPSLEAWVGGRKKMREVALS